MKKSIKSLFPAFILMGLFVFASCGGDGLSKDDSLKYLSEDASQISVFNVENLMDDMDFESVKEMAFYKDAIKEAATEDAVFAEVLKDPKASGIDIGKNIYQFTQLNATTMEPTFSGVSFNIEDEAEFEELVTKALNDGKRKSVQDYEIISNREMVVAWNGKIGLSGFGKRRKFDEVVEEFFNEEKENSLANKTELTKALSKKSDIAFWANSNTVAKNPAAQMLGFAGIDPKGLEDNYVSGRANFEKGKAIFDLDYDINQKLSKDLDLFFKDELNTDFSDYFPEANRQTLMTVALDLKGIYQVLQEKNFLGFINKGFGPLKEYGLEIKDIKEAFGGDIVVATYKNGDQVDGIFATDVIDAKAQELIDLGVKSGALTDNGNGLYTIDDEEIAKNLKRQMGNDSNVTINTKAKILIKDGKLFISGSDDYLAQIAKGGFSRGDRVDSGVYKKLSNNIFGFDSTNNFTIDGKDGERIDVEGFQVISDRQNTHSELLMDDKSQNALKQIIEQAYEIAKKEREENGGISM